MMFNRFKIFVFLLVAGFLFLTTASPILAQEGIFGAYHKAAQAIGLEKDPAKDPLCWQEKVCYTALQQQFPDAEITKDNWQSPGPNGRCGSDLGVCLPAGTTQLEIKIGQVTEAKDLGDYIKKIYIYLLSIGGIVAAVLLIKGGADWMLSVGESEGIKNAQATIVGALVGLLFLLGSYTLLYTINPDLVNLKLPQVYMVRPAELVEMAEGQPCWEKGVENAACVALGAPGEYTCHPILSDGSSMTGMKITVTVLTSFLSAGGGSAGGVVLKVGSKVGNWAVEMVGKVGGKYVGYFFKAPIGLLKNIWGKYFPKMAAEGTQMSLEAVGLAVKKDASALALRNFAKAVIETGKEGKIAIAKLAVGVPVGAITLGGSMYVSKEVYDLLLGDGKNGWPGICEKAGKWPEGTLCNAKVKTSPDCASGTCLPIGALDGWVSGMTMGVCSSGGAGHFCNEKEDCGTVGGPFECISQECTDFTFGRTCENDSQCSKNNLKCLMSDGYKNRCENEEAAGLGQPCQILTGQQASTGKCQDGLECLKTPFLMSEEPFSVCSDHKIDSPCYKDNECNSGTDYEIGCLDSKLKDQTPSQTQFVDGKCFYVFFNAKYSPLGKKVPVNDPNFLPDTTDCTSNSDCPQAHCAETYNGYKFCAGP